MKNGITRYNLEKVEHLSNILKEHGTYKHLILRGGDKQMIASADRQELARELTKGMGHFYNGTECYYAHWVKSPYGESYKYTDGVQYVAEKGGAHWLLDAIFSYRRKEPFQVWRLEVTEKDEKRSATLTMKEDSGRKPKVTQQIMFTDFPLDSVEMWLIDGVLILHSEY